MLLKELLHLYEQRSPIAPIGSKWTISLHPNEDDEDDVDVDAVATKAIKALRKIGNVTLVNVFDESDGAGFELGLLVQKERITYSGPEAYRMDDFWDALDEAGIKWGGTIRRIRSPKKD
jgi:hypothetical protein